jgi:UDP-2-acetamido-3-amino-2,3-dideoxy-glucuronate N-acetyltransferase
VTCRLGLLGIGRWGRSYVSTVNELDGIEIREVFTSRPERARLVANPVDVFTEWTDVVRSDGSDAVIVATPPATHAAIVRECFSVGKPVLVEKPLCLSIREAAELLDATEHGSPVLVGHTHLFNPLYDELEAVVRHRGDLRFVYSQGLGLGPFRSDVDPLWDWCSHELALCLDLAGTVPASVGALGIAGSREARAHELITLALEFPGGVRAWIHTGSLSPQRVRSLSVFFPDSVISLVEDDGESTLRSFEVPFDMRMQLPVDFKLSAAGEVVSRSRERPLARLVTYFVEGLRGGDTRRFGLQLGADVVSTLDRAQRALDSGLRS